MSLENRIHARWPLKTGLHALLPVERVFTGQAPPGTLLPYATIERIANPSEARTNKSNVRMPGLRVSVWADDFDQGQAIAEEMARTRAGFDRDQFADEDDRVLAMLHDDDRYMQELDGVWRFEVDFMATTHLPITAAA